MGLYPHKTNPISNAVIGCAIEVHKALGPGLLESAYQRCLTRELRLRSIQYASEVALPVCYKGEPLDCGYRLDLVVAGCLIVEVKSLQRQFAAPWREAAAAYRNLRAFRASV